MSFGGGGGGSGSIHTDSDVVLNNPTDGQVLTYNDTLAKWQNLASPASSGYTQAGAQAAFTSLPSMPSFAQVQLSGSTITARKTADGSVISQGTDAATVINAALTAANANTNGGFIELGTGQYLVTSPIVLLGKTGLVGHATYSRTGSVPVGSVLKSSGLGSGQAVVQSGGDGGFMQGVGIHANNQADYAFAHLAGADVSVRDCVLTFANVANLYHSPTAGSYAFVLADCELWHSGNYGIQVASGTDGRITNCGVFESANICCYIGAGGWLLSGCHITHASALTTTINTQIAGSTCVITGNYFDSCKNGPTLKLSAAGITVTGNYILNQTSNNGGTLAVALVNAQGTNITGNTTHTDSGSTGMQWTTGSLPVSGVYGPNFHLGASSGYVDANNNPVSVQTTQSLYVGPNPYTG